jgi:hypothetical protein
MERMTRRALAAAVLALVGRTVEAQSIRGVVADRADAPVNGVVVLMLDSSSAVVSRALTNESGEFRVAARAPGVYRLRSMRIGYRPTVSPPIVLAAGGDVTQRLVLDDIPFSLETVRVSSRSSCSIRADTAATTFGVWEQVRAALNAAKLTAGDRTLTARVVGYSRGLEGSRRNRVLWQSARVTEGLTTRPYRAISADSLSRIGYVMADVTGATSYFAPDLDVLLSDRFIDEHCLRIVSIPNQDYFSILFEPTRERARIPEIKGVVFIDRKTSQLQRLTFEYVNLPPDKNLGDPGGEVEFVRLKNGAWMIARWNIRMPLVEGRAPPQTVADAVSGLNQRVQYVVREMVHEGGMLTFVRRGADTLWSQRPLDLAGIVRDQTSEEPVPGTIVALRGTNQSDTTDAEGRFAVPDVLPGEYAVDIRTPALASAGAVHSETFVLVDSTTTLTALVPRAEQFLMSACGGEPTPRTGIIAGSVRVPGDTSAPRNIRVVGEWDHFMKMGSEIIGQRRLLDVRTDAHGAFRLCNVPENTAISLTAETEKAASVPLEVRIIPGQRYLMTDVVLLPIAVNATFSGTVVSTADRVPIQGAELVLSGVPSSAYSDSAGRFHFPSVPPGTHPLTVRKVGYKAVAMVIAFGSNEQVQRSIVLEPVQPLDPVEVKGALIASFEENRRIGQGSFLTRADLAKFESRKTSEALAAVPGLGMVRGASRAWVFSNRTRAATRGRPAMAGAADANSGARQDVCYSHVYIDNVQVYGASPKTDPRSRSNPEPLFDINSIPPSQIEAVEFYASPAQTPVKYARIGASCGVLIIHTRRPY